MGKKYPVDFHRQGQLNCLLVDIFQRYQLNFTTLLCLKKSICKSAFRKDIVMVVVAFSENRCIIPDQLQFIHTNFLVSIFTRAYDIVPTLNRCSDDINLSAFSSLGLYPTTGRFHSAQREGNLNNKADNPDTSFQKSGPYNQKDTVSPHMDRSL